MIRRKCKDRVEEPECLAAPSCALLEQKPAKYPQQPPHQPLLYPETQEEKGVFSHQYTSQQLWGTQPSLPSRTYPMPESAHHPAIHTSTESYSLMPIMSGF